MLKTWLIKDLPFAAHAQGVLFYLTFLAHGAGDLRRFEDNLPPLENNQQPSASRAHCNETWIYFLFPPAVAALRHDWAYVELFTALAVEGEEKQKTTNNLRFITSWDVVRRRRRCRAAGDGTGPNMETVRNPLPVVSENLREAAEKLAGFVWFMQFKYVFL